MDRAAEGAKFWLKVMNEFQIRGVGDILIAVVDSLTGSPDAIATVFPQTAVQICIMGLLKNPVSGRSEAMASCRGLRVCLSPWRRSGSVKDPIRRGGGASVVTSGKQRQ